MAEYTLHCFAQSGNAYKAALMLNLCGADWQPRHVDFFNGETRTPEYRAKLNEMGEVPVLQHRGQTLTQSGVILDYLACTRELFGWSSDGERREIMRWLLWDNHKLTSYIATLRYFLQFAPERDEGVVEFLRGRVKGALGILEKHLAQAPYAVGGRLTIADLSICGYLFWPDEFGVSWEDHPHIASWLERIRSQPGWVHPYELMPGHPLPAKP
jgi:glutathione S-transferase